ncbi:MAG: alpha/beta fold hydrolase [Clostridia bacterium]|nr:alpha/beta fold hydrolase [Clostridia bacterium]
MSYKYTKNQFLSSNGKAQIAYHIYEPNAAVKAIVQLSHGMCEYVRRYEHVAEFFCKNGIVFCGNDHLGHGDTAVTDENLGFTSEGGGADFMVEDVRKLTEIIKERYPDKPIILFGHSMGSFIARLYLTKYTDISAAIIEGTGGPESPTAMGKTVASAVMKFKGERYRSKMLDSIAFGNYNRRIGKHCAVSAWLSRDDDLVSRYMSDRYCKYVFTARGFYDLFDLLGRVSEKSWAELVPKTLPILLASGDADPVGNYGRGVKAVYDRLVAAGVENVTLKLYPDARHELHNETNKDEFLRDVLDFISTNVKL